MDLYPAFRFYPNWLYRYCSPTDEFLISVIFSYQNVVLYFCSLLRVAWVCYCNFFNPLKIKNNVNYT